MKRLVCIVEGHGEVKAIPSLCSRILSYLGIYDWLIEQNPIRHPRNRLVDQSVQSPNRPCRPEEIAKVLQVARRSRNADAVLILCDSDDDCPGPWAHSVEKVAKNLSIMTVGVMAVREYETWLIHSFSLKKLASINVDSPEKIRDAKKILKNLLSRYSPTTDQLGLTRKLDIAQVMERSKSFDKLVRSLSKLCQKKSPWVS